MSRARANDIDKILEKLASRGDAPLSLKDERGTYLYANEAWAELAQASVSTIVGRRDEQLLWGDASNNRFNQFMDTTTRARGFFKSVDRRPHFQGQYWICSAIEKFYEPASRIVVSAVSVKTHDETFCRLASAVTERGLEVNGVSLSLKQLYLAHQLLFHVPHKQTARELGCSPNRINQQVQDLKDVLDAGDTAQLICRFSAFGLFPLLEHFDLLFKYDWISADFKTH